MAVQYSFVMKGLTKTFPDVVAMLLGLDLEQVLDKDPSEWTSAGELSAFLS